eukprot:TRINITY_DN10099_c0_g1_i2.p2 TRINITY_DN10099_c0_g1~~TRINITY_DN10099_c0_g1_i2.p2  ORF type:complete len:144 (-),score=28.84 TRINITY_DN10099_c0_g1_i2:55-486(-)
MVEKFRCCMCKETTEKKKGYVFNEAYAVYVCEKCANEFCLLMLGRYIESMRERWSVKQETLTMSDLYIPSNGTTYYNTEHITVNKAFFYFWYKQLKDQLESLKKDKKELDMANMTIGFLENALKLFKKHHLSLIHICRCRRAI